MADNTVMATLYAKEWVSAYEQKQSWLRNCCQIEGEVAGDNFIFIIEGVADEARERTANGNIPYASDDQASATCTLKEYHHLVRKNRFRIYSSSVPQRTSMQNRGVVAVNYKTDQLIIDQMETTTYQTSNAGTGAAMTLRYLLEMRTTLDENNVPDDGERYCVLTPKAWSQALDVNQFTSVDWVADRPYMKNTQWREWQGVKFAMHPNLPGKTSSTASCFMWHKAAIGHALNMGEVQTKIGENDEQDYSWARASAYQGSKALQLAGIVEMVHDDTAALG